MTPDPIQDAVEAALTELWPRRDETVTLAAVTDRALEILRELVDAEIARRFGWASDEDGAHDMARDDAACGLSA